MISQLLTALRVASVLSLFGAAQVAAHEGHDQGPPSPVAAANLAPRGEAHSDLFELVAVVRGDGLVIYLDRFATNEPVTDATIEVETPEGPQKAAASGQMYSLAAPWVMKPGRHDLVVTVTVGGHVDILPVSIEAPGAQAATSTDRSAWSRVAALLGDVADGLAGKAGVMVSGLGGFLAGLSVMTFARRRKRGAAAAAMAVAIMGIAVTGTRIEAADATPIQESAGELAQRLPNGAVFMPKSTQRILAVRTTTTEQAIHRRSVELPGRVIPDPNASGFVQASVGGRLSAPPGGFPRLGTRVKKGDVLAYVTPPLQAIDISDMRQRQGELDQQISIVERRLARYEQLAPTGAVARSQLEETRLELQGLKERRASLDKVRREPEELIAPVDGAIAEGTPVAGQIAQPNAVVFHIVDPSRLWIEALSYETIPAAPNAAARMANGKTVQLVFQGSGLADRSQSIPLHFSVEGDGAGLRIGQFVTVFVKTTDAKEGIAVPRSSVVRGRNGQDVVFEQVSAEMFEPRAVRIEPLDGETVLIPAGLAGGRRLVVQGAELLDQVR